MQQPERTAPAPVPSTPPVAVAPAPEPVLTTHEKLAKELATQVQGVLVSLAENAGRTSITIRHYRQFSSGDIQPDPAARAILEQVAVALDRVPGAILVRGYADSVPVNTGAFASNTELSAARAKAAATLIAAKLREQQRVASEGVGEADPIAPNDTEANRARNRRVAIVLGARP